MLCEETIRRLIEIYRDEPKVLAAMERCFVSFEEYHAAIVKMELWRKLYAKAVDADEFRSRITEMDKNRTLHHNSVLGSVSMLNRLAEKNGLAPVYDGIVDKEQPYRRMVANDHTGTAVAMCRKKKQASRRSGWLVHYERWFSD